MPTLYIQHCQYTSLLEKLFCLLFCWKFQWIRWRNPKAAQRGDRYCQQFAVRINNKFNLAHFLKLGIHFPGNILTLAAGSGCGWSSANFLEFQKPDTPLPSGPMTLKESTFVMSIYFIGAIVGNLISPHIVKKFGSKRTMYAIGCLQIVSSLSNCGYISLKWIESNQDDISLLMLLEIDIWIVVVSIMSYEVTLTQNLLEQCMMSAQFFVFEKASVLCEELLRS